MHRRRRETIAERTGGRVASGSAPATASWTRWFTKWLPCGLWIGLGLAPDDLPAQSALPVDPRERAALAAATASARQGRLAEAIAALEPLPVSYSVSLPLGRLQFAAGNHAESERHLRAAMQARPASIEALLAYLQPLLALGRFTEAETFARKILAADSGNLIATLQLSAALRGRARSQSLNLPVTTPPSRGVEAAFLREADRLLTHFLRRYPADVRVLTELGYLKAARNQLSAARHYLNEALALNPDYEPARSKLAEPALFADLADLTGPDQPDLWLAAAKQPRWDAIIYAGRIAYDGGTIKRDATLAGLAATLTVNRVHTFHTGVDFAEIERVALPRLHQTDLTLAYANLALDYVRLRCGGHHLSSDDPATDGGWTFSGGAETYVPGRWNLGADIHFTRYSDFAPRLDVVQLSPHYGRVLRAGKAWGLRLEATGHWIQLNQLAGPNRRNFISGEGRLTLTGIVWSAALLGWAGRQAFAVRNGGHTAFNLAEVHTGGYGLELRRILGPGTALAVRYAREEFREVGAGGAAANTLLGTFGFSF